MFHWIHIWQTKPGRWPLSWKATQCQRTWDHWKDPDSSRTNTVGHTELCISQKCDHAGINSAHPALRLLQSDEKQTRHNVFKGGRSWRFLRLFITAVHHFQAERKEQSKQWNPVQGFRPQRRSVRSTCEVMASVSWDVKGVLLVVRLEKSQFYADPLRQLWEKVKKIQADKEECSPNRATLVQPCGSELHYLFGNLMLLGTMWITVRLCHK